MLQSDLLNGEVQPLCDVCVSSIMCFFVEFVNILSCAVVWSVLLLPWLSACFQQEHKGSISKASHDKLFRHYWPLIKAVLNTVSFPSLSHHQWGSIRPPDNGRWHMPAFITKPAVTGTLICVCAKRFLVTERGRSHLIAVRKKRGIPPFWLICYIASPLAGWSLTLPAVWHNHLHAKHLDKGDIHVRRAKNEKQVVFTIQYACISGWQRKWWKVEIGSIVITE